VLSCLPYRNTRPHAASLLLYGEDSKLMASPYIRVLSCWLHCLRVPSLRLCRVSVARLVVLSG
jgi:hypothetical protein